MVTTVPAGTPNWDVPLNAALNDLQGQITANLDKMVYNVRDHGVTGNGTTDDAPAINALISLVAASAAHGTIYFPRGTYLLGSALLPTVAMRFTGDQGAVIRSTASNIFNFAGNYMHPGAAGQQGVLEIDHLILDATGGHVFTAPNINQGSFHDLILYQRSPDKSVWNQTTGSLLWVKFENIISNTYGATRTAPGWLISGSSTADVANLTFDHCLFQNPDLDATQYQVVLQATAGTSGRYYHEQNAFRDCYFEQPFGGAVKSLSGQGTVFDNCRVYDVFSKAVGNSMFYIGQAANSTWPSTNTTFSGTGRDLQGPNGSTTWDIQLESTCLQTEISQYDVRDIPGTFTGSPFLNLGNSAGVVLSNNRAQTLTNANGAGLWNFTSDGSQSGSGAPTNFTAADLGLKAWTYDSIASAGAGSATTTGVIYLAKVIVRQPTSVTNVVLFVATAGTTLTASQSFAGVYDSTGTLVGTTADQSVSWTSTGYKSMALAGGPFTLNPGAYWIAWTSNGSTPPQILRSQALNGTLYNGSLPASQYRYATNGTGTTLPATITPASNAVGLVAWWAALS